MIDYISIIISLVAAIGSISAVLLAWRKAPVETEQVRAQTASTKADTVQRYEAIVARYAEEQDQMRQKLDCLEVQMNKQDKDYRVRLQGQDEEIAELRAGIILLIAQLEARGDTPIWRPKERKAKA